MLVKSQERGGSVGNYAVGGDGKNAEMMWENAKNA